MINKLIGLEFSEFEKMMLVKEGEKEPEINARPARLIPICKDEGALTSIFLSGMKLIKEFQKHFLSEIDLKSGQIYVYREVNFKKPLKNFPEGSRLDGLLIVVKGSKIQDAIFFEMKSKANPLEPNQIIKYAELAESLGVDKIVTISNYVTASPLQFPLDLKISKKIKLTHFSWEYVIAVARMFLHTKKDGIEDKDQKEIMKEILMYLEDGEAGAGEFKDVRREWKDFNENLKNGVPLKPTDECVKATTSSWAQVEGHLSLVLSSTIGELVSIVEPKAHKDDLKLKLEDCTNCLLKENMLASSFRVKNTISDIDLKLFFARKAVEFSILISPPKDKETTKSKVSWLKKDQLDYCERKFKELFTKMSPEVFIEVSVRNSKETPQRIILKDIESIVPKIGDREIKDFRLVYVKNNMAKQIETGKFVAEIDLSMINFYNLFVQNLKPVVEKPAKVLTDEINKIDSLSTPPNVIEPVHETEQVVIAQEVEKIAS